MILLATCAIIWIALEPSKLTPKAKKAINRSQQEMIISDISIWEISVLTRRKRLVIDDTAAGFMNLIIQSLNCHIQPITPEIAKLSVHLGAEINNDPADRLIAATPIIENAPVITVDQNLRDAAILETIW